MRKLIRQLLLKLTHMCDRKGKNKIGNICYWLYETTESSYMKKVKKLGIRIDERNPKNKVSKRIYSFNEKIFQELEQVLEVRLSDHRNIKRLK